MKFFSILLIVTFYAGVIVLPATADTRLDKFVERYDALRGKNRVSVNHPDHPFYPYQNKFIEAGLDETGLRALQIAHEKGDCLQVDRLAVAGFLDLYPFLKPAFLQRKNRLNLEFLLIADVRPLASRRCNSHKWLRELSDRGKQKDIPPLDMHQAMDEKYKKRLKHSPAWNDFLSFNIGLGDMAFCQGYLPAIKDVFSMAGKPGGLLLTAGENQYLAGLMKVKSGNNRRLENLAAIGGFWPKACRDMEIQRKSK